MPSLVRNTSVGGSTTNVTGLNATTHLSVAIWCRAMSSSSATDVLRQSSTANVARDGYRIGFENAGMRLDLMSATASNNHSVVSGGRHRDGRWHHFAAVFDTNDNAIYGYFDGKLVQRTAATQNVSANASCTTNLNPGVIGSGSGFFLFDLQIFPDVVLSGAEVAQIMNPRFKHPLVKGRYFGPEFRTTAIAAGALRDESGNGNNLTVSPTALQQGEEPPYLPTIG